MTTPRGRPRRPLPVVRYSHLGGYYYDDGCEDGELPSCLLCPLPQCRYDLDPNIMRRESAQRRAAMIAEYARKTGGKVEAVAALFGVSTRTVHRALKGAA